jgi:class 3 adenylate cyclase
MSTTRRLAAILAADVVGYTFCSRASLTLSLRPGAHHIFIASGRNRGCRLSG